MSYVSDIPVGIGRQSCSTFLGHFSAIKAEMAIHVALRHQTRYGYDRPVSLSPHVIRLRPAPHCRTPVLSYSLKLNPRKHFINWQQDPHGNYLARVVFPDKTQELVVDVELVAEMSVHNPFDFFLEPSAEEFPFSYDASLAKELAPFLERLPAGPRLAAFVDAVDTRKQRTVDFLVALNRRVSQTVKYIIRLEPGVQTPEDTLTLASGSCRDSAWLLVQVLRHLGLAARFVSGYLIQLKADVKALDGPQRNGGGLHGPARVDRSLLARRRLDRARPHIGAHGRRRPPPARGHARSARGRSGHRRGRRMRGDVRSRDERARGSTKSPRVTKPYTDEQWRQIDALGRCIDAELTAQRRAPDDGRRADVCFDRRHGRRRVELHGARSRQAPPGRHARPAPEATIRAGSAAALRPGQVVSGRIAAALGAGVLVAARRRSDLERRPPRRRRDRRLRPRRRRSEPVHPRARRRPCGGRQRTSSRPTRTSGTTS